MTLKKMLEDRGMSGYRFSQLSGIHLPAVYALINGKRDPLKMRVYSAKRAADALEISLDEFYNAFENEVIEEAK